MAANKIAIANLALSKIGSANITSFTQSGSVEAGIINTVYDDILKEVLSEHPWSFAQKRATLEYVVPDDTSRTIQGRVYTPVTITGATAAEPVVITAVNHGLSNGDRIKIVGIIGMTQLNNNFYRIANKTTDTFELIDEDTGDDIDGSAYTTYSSAGKVHLANDRDPLIITAATAANPVVITSASHGLEDGDWVLILGVSGMTQLNGNFYIVDNATTNTFSLQDTDEEDVNGLAYTTYVSGGEILVADEIAVVQNQTAVVYEKPSDYVKITGKSILNALILVEQDKIISDMSELVIKYTFFNEDVTQYFPKFVQALSTRLAAEICFNIVNSVSKSEALLKFYYDNVLPMAVSVDSTQDTPTEAMQDEWLNSRIVGTGSGYATFGQTWHPV